MTPFAILLFPLMAFASPLLSRSVDCSTNATVQTSSGSIMGHSASNRTQAIELLGIPYAQPPVGSLRFAAPRKYNSNQTFNASKFVSIIKVRGKIANWC